MKNTISIIWAIEDVQDVRKDLTDEQAWEVLKAVEKGHDADIGVTWDFLRNTADDMFPKTVLFPMKEPSLTNK